MTQTPKPVTAQRLIATATACRYLDHVSKRNKADAAALARALDGIALTQAHVHALALGAHHAGVIASIITAARHPNRA